MSVLKSLLLGGQAYTSVDRILDNLTLGTATARVQGLPFTIYGLVWHLEFCQDLLLKMVAGEDVHFPPAAEQWPSGEPTEEEWEELVSRTRAGVYEASELTWDVAGLDARDRELLEDLAGHNAYHWGQVVVMRRLLGDWHEGEVER